MLIPRSGGWCACSRTLWVFPTSSPVRLGFPPTASNPTGSFSPRLWDFISLHCNLGCTVTLAPQLFPMVHLLRNVGPPALPADTWSGLHVASFPWVLSTWLTFSTPSTIRGECFFFNSLIGGLLSFLVVFKFVVVILFILETGKVYTPVPPSQPEVRVYKFYRPTMWLSNVVLC